MSRFGFRVILSFKFSYLYFSFVLCPVSVETTPGRPHTDGGSGAGPAVPLHAPAALEMNMILEMEQTEKQAADPGQGALGLGVPRAHGSMTRVNIFQNHHYLLFIVLKTDFQCQSYLSFSF